MRRRIPTLAFVPALVAGLMSPVVGAAPALGAQPIAVTIFEDVVDAGDGEISLREAVQVAAVDVFVDEIRVPAGTYVLTAAAGGQLAVSNEPGQDLTIRGLGGGATIVAAPDHRIIDAVTSADLTLENLTLRDGDVVGYGGAVEVTESPSWAGETTFTLRGVNLLDNTSREVPGNPTSALGGAVRTTAALVVEDSEFAGNRAINPDGGAFGGAINAAGKSAHLTRVTFRDNTVEATTAAGGGAARLLVTGVGVSGRTIILEDVEFVDNRLDVEAASASTTGGALQMEGNAALDRVRIEGTVVSGTSTTSVLGGGLSLRWGSSEVGLAATDVAVVDTTVTAGKVVGGGLAADVSGLDDTAVMNRLAVVGTTVDAATTSGLAAWLGPADETMVDHLTISDTTATGGARDEDRAAALAVDFWRAEDHLDLRHATIAGNHGAGIHHSNTSGAAFPAAAVRVEASVIAANDRDCVRSAPDAQGLGSGGNNRTSSPGGSAHGCSLNSLSDEVVSDPRLGPVVDDGTAVPHRFPLGDSPLRDQITSSPLAVDVRGVARPQGTAADVGAVERRLPTASDEAASTDDRTPVTVDVLADDQGGEGPIGHLTLPTDAPTSAAVTADQRLVFTPSAGDTATTSIPYLACEVADPTACAPATLTVEVTTAAGKVERYFGADRFVTAAAISSETFDPGVSVAYVATGLAFPDALAGGPVAGRDGAPILLTTPGSLPAPTRAELARLAPGRIVVLGGAAAVSDAVMDELSELTTGEVTRLHGPDRYATAAALAGSFDAPAATVYLATGEAFPDALSGGALAAADGAPVLLTAPGHLPSATAEALTVLAPREVVILGGPAAVSAAVEEAVVALTGASTTRFHGPDRFATSTAIAGGFPAPVDTLYVATGQAFPDALAGTPAAAVAGAPVVLVQSGALPDGVADVIRTLDPVRILVLGGEAAVAPPVVAALEGLLAEAGR